MYLLCISGQRNTTYWWSKAKHDWVLDLELKLVREVASQFHRQLHVIPGDSLLLYKHLKRAQPVLQHRWMLHLKLRSLKALLGTLAEAPIVWSSPIQNKLDLRCKDGPMLILLLVIQL